MGKTTTMQYYQDSKLAEMKANQDKTKYYYSFYQAPGKYAGGAICIVTNAGEKIYSNAVLYEVKAIPTAEVTNDAVAVKDERESKCCQ